MCEMRWKKSGEIPTDGGHRVYFGGKEDKHEQGVGFLVHKDIVKNVIGCRPVSSSAVAYVSKTRSRSFRLLIRVVIYQIVHLDKQVPKMVVANFFQKF